MRWQKLYRLTIWSQGIYTFITAVWPIVDLESFMLVSGYKTDIWLVKTVSILLLIVSVCLLINTSAVHPTLPVIMLALLVAVAMAYVDFYYSLNGTISNIYLADGVVEILFIISWLIILIKNPAIKRD